MIFLVLYDSLGLLYWSSGQKAGASFILLPVHDCLYLGLGSGRAESEDAVGVVALLAPQLL